MPINSYNFISSLKLYHIILYVCIINYVYCLNIQKPYSKLRKLFIPEYCHVNSLKLIDNYNSGDLSKLDEDIKDYPNKDSKYIKSLFDIANNLVYQDIEELYEEGETFDKEKDLKKNTKIYLSQFKLLFIFFIISIIGWIFCLFCTYCNWCCCCCCKKECCTSPFFIVNLIIYILIISISIYALFQLPDYTNHSLCLYKIFLGTFIYGEGKETEMRWKGLENIIDNFKYIKSLISKMKDDNKERMLNISINSIENEKDEFFKKLKFIHRNFFNNDEMTPLEGYFIDYPDNSNYYVEHLSKLYLRKRYILDLLPLFGRYHSINDSFSGLLSVWNDEFSDNYKEAKASMDKVKTSFKNIVEKKYLSNSINKINDLKKPMEIIYENREKTIKDKLEKIIYIGRFITIFLLFFITLFECINLFYIYYVMHKLL